jgi:flagellar M-ring protein FliF
VRASVTLDYDPSASDVTQESYDPNQTATLSMQRSEQVSGAQPVAAGVPGTASNAPNSQALPVYPQQATPPQSVKTESGTYGVSKTVRHVVENSGRVRRLTAAIVVNDRLLQSGSKGNAPVWQPRSAEELRNLTALAQAAVGFDTARGDALTVEDLAFDENRPQQPLPLAGQILSGAESSPVLVKYAALLIGLMVVLAFGVRPALRHSAPAAGGTGRSRPRELAAESSVAVTSALPAPEPMEMDPERLRAQGVFEQVAAHLKREPTQSSRLLQSWIHSD